jgi:predicted DNA-binding transcriptional regulator YafY
MIRGDKTHDVELVFDKEFAETIADTHWHDSQQIIWNDDGSITFACKVDGLDEIVWWVMSMGPHCAVLKPAELVARVCELARRTLEQYATRQAGR